MRYDQRQTEAEHALSIWKGRGGGGGQVRASASLYMLIIRVLFLLVADWCVLVALAHIIQHMGNRKISFTTSYREHVRASLWVMVDGWLNPPRCRCSDEIAELGKHSRTTNTHPKSIWMAKRSPTPEYFSNCLRCSVSSYSSCAVCSFVSVGVHHIYGICFGIENEEHAFCVFFSIISVSI